MPSVADNEEAATAAFAAASILAVAAPAFAHVPMLIATESYRVEDSVPVVPQEVGIIGRCRKKRPRAAH